jgi:hypothetical protein
VADKPSEQAGAKKKKKKLTAGTMRGQRSKVTTESSAGKDVCTSGRLAVNGNGSRTICGHRRTSWPQMPCRIINSFPGPTNALNRKNLISTQQINISKQ